MISKKKVKIKKERISKVDPLEAYAKSKNIILVDDSTDDLVSEKITDDNKIKSKMTVSEYTNKYKQALTSYKTNKTSLKSIVKDKKYINVIEDTVINVNKIIMHTYNVLKLYYLYCYENNLILPSMDKKFVNAIMKLVCEPPTSGVKQFNILTSESKNDENYDQLYDYYMDNYRPIQNDNLTYTRLNTCLDYASIEIITNFSNHIIQHWYDLFNSYINIICKKHLCEKLIAKSSKDSKSKKIEIDKYRRRLSKFKKDLYDWKNKCDNVYEKILKKKIRRDLLNVFNKDTPIGTQIKSNPLKYLPMFIKMSIEVENMRDNGYLHAKSINCFPLRRSIIPKYITFDTITILRVLGYEHNINVSFYEAGGNTIKYRDEIWNTFFKLYSHKVNHKYVSTKRTKKNKKGRKISKTRKKRLCNDRKRREFEDKKYIFHHQICTDGIGCSILLIRKDLYKPDERMMIRVPPKPLNYKEEQYLDELTDTEKNKYTNHVIAGIDPGKRDLIHATTGETKFINGKRKTVQFRYTQGQRTVETKSRKYNKILGSYMRYSSVKTDGSVNLFCKKNGYMKQYSTIKETENLLCYHDSKSCIYERTYDYIHMKNIINRKLFKFYSTPIFRKLKWYGYINRQRSESKMINAFKKKIGGPEKTLICFGDWEQRKHMRYKEPTKGKGFRKLFRKAGYSLYLIDEYNTSKKYISTGTDMKKFRIRKNPKYDRSNPKSKPTKLCHGLLRCKCELNANSDKYVLMNRDLNGSLNIRKKAIIILKNEEFPEYFKRKQNNFQGYINTSTSASLTIDTNVGVETFN